MLKCLRPLVVRRVFKLPTLRCSAAGIEPISVLVLRKKKKKKNTRAGRQRRCGCRMAAERERSGDQHRTKALERLPTRRAAVSAPRLTKNYPRFASQTSLKGVF